MLLLLKVLGTAAGVMTGALALTTSLTMYHQFSSQFIQNLQWVAQIISSLQWQIDSLAAIVLQNQQALDLLTGGESNISLFLKETFCNYANLLSAVKGKIQLLQIEFQKFKDQLHVSGQQIIENTIRKWILLF